MRRTVRIPDTPAQLLAAAARLDAFWKANGIQHRPSLEEECAAWERPLGCPCPACDGDGGAA